MIFMIPRVNLEVVEMGLFMFCDFLRFFKIGLRRGV